MAEDAQGRKEFVGLLVQKGRVRHAAPPLHGLGQPDHPPGPVCPQRVRPDADGTPQIVWAATDAGPSAVAPTYAGPMGRRRAAWHIADAVGCGPTLISGGKVVVTQYQERLVSPGPRPRTFVAYDSVNGSRGIWSSASPPGRTFTPSPPSLPPTFPAMTAHRPRPPCAWTAARPRR